MISATLPRITGGRALPGFDVEVPDLVAGVLKSIAKLVQSFDEDVLSSCRISVKTGVDGT